MSSDQVRWKINALTKKYKECLHKSQLIKFKYFREMDKIYAQYNLECNTFSNLNDVMNRRKNDITHKKYIKTNGQSKAMIDLRKVRLAHRIESVRLQSKINLENQWLEYLKSKEQSKLLLDEVLDKRLKIREEKFKLRQQKLLIEESLELRQLEANEREENEMLSIERKKCELLYSIIANRTVI